MRVAGEPKIPTGRPRVLIVRLGAMGDVLHALPAVAILRRSLPEAKIAWVVERRWRELLCAPGTDLAGSRGPGRPLVDEVHLVDTRTWRKHIFSSETRREFQSAVRGLRANSYDAALDMQGAIKSSVLARLSGARLIFGFQHPREKLARHFYYSLVAGGSAHVMEQNLEIVQSLLKHLRLAPATEALQPGAALLPRDERSEERIARLLQPLAPAGAPLAILTPGAGWAAKQWASARYGELASRLADRGFVCIINYGPGEERLAREAVDASRGAATPLFSSLSEFIALSRRARLSVGGDTGPMHLAALLGVRTIALFGPTDPARNGPYWAGTRVLRHPSSITSYSHKRTEDAGLEQIAVDEVLLEAEALLR